MIDDSYKRTKLKEWEPMIADDTINSWSGKQLEAIYREKQQKFLKQVTEGLGVKDFRGLLD